MMDLVVGRTEAMAHILGPSLINADGDTAAAETSFIGYLRLPGDDGGSPQMNQLIGGRRPAPTDWRPLDEKNMLNPAPHSSLR